MDVEAALAWRKVERALRDLHNNIDDIDGVTDSEWKKLHINWAMDSCDDLRTLLEGLIPDA